MSKKSASKKAAVKKAPEAKKAASKKASAKKTATKKPAAKKAAARPSTAKKPATKKAAAKKTTVSKAVAKKTAAKKPATKKAAAKKTAAKKTASKTTAGKATAKPAVKKAGAKAKTPAPKSTGSKAKPSKPAASKATAAKASASKATAAKGGEAKPGDKPADDGQKKPNRKGITIVSKKPSRKSKAKTVTPRFPPTSGRLLGPGSPIRRPLIPSGPSAPPPEDGDGLDAKSGKRKSPFKKRDLDRFRNILLIKRAQLIGDVSQMEAEALLGNAGDVGRLPQHLAEQGSDSYERSLNLDLAAADRRLIKEIDDAIERINDGVYGSCEKTGKPIRRERLEELPWARYSIEAARAIERAALGQ